MEEALLRGAQLICHELLISWIRTPPWAWPTAGSPPVPPKSVHVYVVPCAKATDDHREQRALRGTGSWCICFGDGDASSAWLTDEMPLDGRVPSADGTEDSLRSCQGRAHLTGLSLAAVLGLREAHRAHHSTQPGQGGSPEHYHDLAALPDCPPAPGTVPAPPYPTADKSTRGPGDGTGRELGIVLSSPLPSSWQSRAFRDRRCLFFFFPDTLH